MAHLNTTRRQLLASAAAGVALAASAKTIGAADSTASPRVLPIRECYCPAHFGNSYEAMWPREMAAYLGEVKWMGFNRYGDWITTTDVCNPYTSTATWDLAKEQLDRKRKAFTEAQRLGLDLNLIVTPNHVYLDQLRPEYAAKTSAKIFGQLVCPSQPAARKLILDNFTRWFDDFADSGIRLSAFTAFAYDYGGCDCEQCRPWILTFAKLMREIHAIAAKRHPQIEPWMCSWWWTPQEHEQFNAWAAAEAPQWLKGMTLHIEYGKTCFRDVAVPAGCRKLAFVHTGYGGNRQNNDVYAKWGAVVAPRRIPQTLIDIAAAGSDGFQIYSEGVFEDCNKMLIAGIGSGQYCSAEDALAAYAMRYFGADAARARQWAQWMAPWEDRTKVDLAAAEPELEKLAGSAKPSWRLEHWRSKLQLEKLNRLIGLPAPEQWTAQKLALAEQFFAEQEHLFRDVYRLGPVRHVINPRIWPAPWVPSWQKAMLKRQPNTMPVLKKEA